MTWTVTLTRTAFKQLARLPEQIQDLADLAITDLELQGLHLKGWNSLKTGDNQYRIRLNYRYRMRYRQVDASEVKIEVFFVGHRREAYR